MLRWHLVAGGGVINLEIEMAFGRYWRCYVA
jgi:hypothetical protein